MHNYRRWLSFDTFKLIVAVILVILLLLVPRALTPPSPAAPAASAATPAGPAAPGIPQELRDGLPRGYQVRQEPSGSWAIIAADGTPLFLWNAARQQWSAIEGLTAAQPATSAPTAIPTTAPTATAPPPTAVPTAAPTQPPTEAPAPTEASAQAPTSVSTTEPAATVQPAAASECSAAAPARLQVGQSARITSNLNLRSSPGIGDNLLKVNLAGTTLKITGGPQCLPYAGGAYRWWQVQAPDGSQGWSAEATLNGGMYFLEPLP